MKKVHNWSVTTLFALILISGLSVNGNAYDEINNVETNYFGNFFSTLTLTKAEFKILNLVNYERERKNMGKLVADSKLTEMARSYSRKMANENFFSHRDRKGDNVADRANDYKVYNWQKIGENIYYCEGCDDPTESAVNGWMKSSSHRKNMMKSDWTSTGIGIFQSNSGRTYVTQVFVKY